MRHIIVSQELDRFGDRKRKKGGREIQDEGEKKKIAKLAPKELMADGTNGHINMVVSTTHFGT